MAQRHALPPFPLPSQLRCLTDLFYPPTADRRSYVPPVQIGEVMRGAVVGRVLASRSARARAGDLVTAQAGWREVAVVGEAQFEAPVALPPGCGPADLLGVFGFTGLTAYFGLAKIGRPRPGDTVVVSGAAGATGSIAGQIARLQGARVVGIAGSDAKVRWLRDELGFDAALNYNAPDFAKRFKEATPNFIDVYWDNGGWRPGVVSPLRRKRVVADRDGSRRRDPGHGPAEGKYVCALRHVWSHQPVQRC